MIIVTNNCENWYNYNTDYKHTEFIETQNSLLIFLSNINRVIVLINKCF